MCEEMKKMHRTKLQQELIDDVGELIETRLELAKFIRELMADSDFPNNPDWIARMLVHHYNIRRR